MYTKDMKVSNRLDLSICVIKDEDNTPRISARGSRAIRPTAHEQEHVVVFW
jgi:hypothetical protein